MVVRSIGIASSVPVRIRGGVGMKRVRRSHRLRRGAFGTRRSTFTRTSSDATPLLETRSRAQHHTPVTSSSDGCGAAVPVAIALAGRDALTSASSRTPAGNDLDLAGVDPLPVRPDEHGHDRGAVALAPRQAGLLAADGVSPLHERNERSAQLTAALRQLVLVSIGSLLVADAFEDSGFDETFEAARQDVARDAEAVLELVEPFEAEERVADDQQRPPFPDELERSSDGAVLSFVVTFQHGHRIATDLLRASYSC
jgi:hypothetical protein